MWVATPSASSRGTSAALVLATSSADAGAAVPPADDEPPPPDAAMTATTISATSTRPASIHANGMRGFVAAAARLEPLAPPVRFDGAVAGRLAAPDFDFDDAGGDFGLGFGLTDAPRTGSN